MHSKNKRHRLNSLLFLAQCRYTKIAQRIFKYSDIQYTSLTPNKKLNSLIYRTLFYANIIRELQTSKNSPVFCPTLYKSADNYVGRPNKTENRIIHSKGNTNTQ